MFTQLLKLSFGFQLYSELCNKPRTFGANSTNKPNGNLLTTLPVTVSPIECSLLYCTNGVSIKAFLETVTLPLFLESTLTSI